MSLRSLALFLLLALASTTPVRAVVTIGVGLPNYTQNFNFLHAASGPGTISWNNDQGTTDTHGSPGWYWQNVGTNPVYNRGNGTAAAGSPYSFRNSDSSTDRAMGSLSGSGTNDKTAWGVVFQNNSGQTITEVTVTYTGEQWRAGVSAADVLTFSYMQSAANLSSPFLDPGGGAVPSGWTHESSLDFDDYGLGNPLHTGTASGTALSGNDAGNQYTMTATFSVTVPDQTFLTLRWYDEDIAGADNSLATDDLVVGFNNVPVPEASAFLLGGLVCGVVGLASARRMLAKRG